MEKGILVFWLFTYLLLWFLRRNPNNLISRAAFTWIGPRQSEGEAWSSFQLRWASYSFGWLCQFAIVFCALLVLALYQPYVADTSWFQVFTFALPLGLGMALLAMIGFLAKAGKAYWLGPNPIFDVA